MTSKSSLFDPHSLYSRLRASIAPEDKMRGYFRWLQLEQQRAQSEDTRVRPLAAAQAKQRHYLILQAARPQEPLQAEMDVFIRRDEDGENRIHLSLGLAPQTDRPRHKTACRAYLLDPAVLELLQTVFAKWNKTGETFLRLARQHNKENVSKKTEAVGKLFSSEFLNHNLEAARILSTVPELEGTVDERGQGDFRPIALAEDCPNIPEHVYVVVVIDQPQE
jgi:hypothetical protein